MHVRVDAHMAVAYALATEDPNELHRCGHVVPPLFGVVPTWDTVERLARSVIPAEWLLRLVHGEQDMHFIRPLVPEETLTVSAEPYNYRVDRFGTHFCIRTECRDEAGDVVLTLYTTSFIRGLLDTPEGGPPKPVHAIDRGALGARIGDARLHVEESAPERYAAASGDANPIHLDQAVARSVGFPRTILHGLCTMAMCANAALSMVGGDGTSVRRVALRFTRPVLPGSDLIVSVWETPSGNGRRTLLFEASSLRRRVVTDGRLELVR